MNQLIQHAAVTELRLRFIRALAIVSIALAIIGLLPTLILTGEIGTPSLGVLTTIALMLGVVWLVLLSRGQVGYAAIGLCASLTLAAMTPPPVFVVIAVIAVIAAAALLNRIGYLIVNVIIILYLAANAIAFTQENPGAVWELSINYIIPLVVLLITSLSSRYLIS
ncbi:MAG: hypothetical protein IH587_08000, partial [Anaerolineae bacterium]|nr:hypothetical protein [Anaerolineae bacterium]